jgi:cytochrome c oxidase assembly protein subunit 15
MLAHGTMAAVIVQILLGALVAGYRAGHASDTFPLMHNRLIPGGMGVDDPWLANLVTNPLTIHFEHRWFAFLVMALATALFVHIRRQGGSPILRTAAMALLHMLVLQIVLGIATILTNVPIWLASLHQVGGVLVFALTCLVLQQTRQRPDP